MFSTGFPLEEKRAIENLGKGSRSKERDKRGKEPALQLSKGRSFASNGERNLKRKSRRVKTHTARGRMIAGTNARADIEKQTPPESDVMTTRESRRRERVGHTRACCR